MSLRGESLVSEKDPGGRVHVWVDGELSALISARDETIVTLRGWLQAERQAHDEARRLLAAAPEHIPAIEAPQEATEVAEMVLERAGRARGLTPQALRIAHRGHR